ncbi:MAG: ATP-grasp domain-containing protein [Porcipelethomonas sp.]
MKKILIIGANPETITLIKKAKNMGLKTYVTDYNKTTYAKKFSDVACNVDGMDVDGLVELVKNENIDAVLVGVAEALIPSYCKVCEILDYPCFADMEQFEIMIAKDNFKNICRKYDVPVVPEYSIEDLDSIEYPVIVKPVDSSSSKGISICKNREELDIAIKKALSFSLRKKILIEKYMSGLEVIIYYVIQDGNPVMVAMCDRYTSKEQKGVTQLPSAYIFPSKHIEVFKSDIDEKVKNMLRGMNIKNGVLFLQSFIENGSIYIYEPGFRLNGAQEHMIVSELTGIDAKELLINYALSGKMSEKNIEDYADPYFHGTWACKLSPLVKEGRIGHISGIEKISQLNGVVAVAPNYEDGEVVLGLGTQRQMAANIFIVATTKELLKERIENVISNFKVTDENGDNMLLLPFDVSIIDRDY